MLISELKEFHDYLFNHDIESSHWFESDDFIEADISDDDFMEFSSDIFCGLKEILLIYSKHQIALGLEYLINTSISFAPYAFLDSSVDKEKRVRAVGDIYNVFEFFNELCDESISHDNDLGGPRINYLCYMWWDIFPRHGVPYKADLQDIDHAILNVIDKVLGMGNIACIESALHGLESWRCSYPEKVDEIIKNNNKNIPDELRHYANKI